MRTTTTALFLTFLAATMALAHEEGVIHLGSKTLAVGGEIEIRGEELPEEAVLRLELQGALETYPLGEIRSDAAGAFRTRLALPAEAGPGSYVVVAIAPDGDEVARADLLVVPAGEGTEGVAVVREPTAEEMELEVSRGPLEWAAILGFVTLCGIGGLALLTAGRGVR